MSAWQIVERFGIYIALGVVLFFGFQGIIGTSGALALIREQRAVSQAQMELVIEQMQSLRAQQQQLAEGIKAVQEEREAIRQHIGTVARKEYHPAMKRVKKANADEQIEEIHRYNKLLRLP